LAVNVYERSVFHLWEKKIEFSHFLFGHNIQFRLSAKEKIFKFKLRVYS
jgi:hypothetical protein